MPDFNIEAMRSKIRDHVRVIAGDEASTLGTELIKMIRMIDHTLLVTAEQRTSENSLSGARWGLLMRLMVEEQRGNLAGITPTELSHHQNVGRNTISALLRGLEEQGLVERSLDAVDRRIFRIRLKDHGRRLIARNGPERIHFANELVSELSHEEQEELLVLLTKLFNSIQAKCDCFPFRENEPFNEMEALHQHGAAQQPITYPKIEE
jgi:DNA-binding MarR family transcriptional regulator